VAEDEGQGLGASDRRGAAGGGGGGRRGWGGGGGGGGGLDAGCYCATTSAVPSWPCRGQLR
jgi:hypothetical protein